MHSVRDVMDRYGVNVGTVLGWIHRGELRAINVGREPGKQKPRWRISDAALAAFEAARSAAPTPAVTRTRRRVRQPEVIEFYS